jgi:cysteine desulfurase
VGVVKPVYLDHQATTPLDPAVLDAMMPYLTEHFGNPHSTTHRAGRAAKAGVDIARQQVANLINAVADEIIFTSGATEANNLALRGVLEAAPHGRNRLVTVATEHSCVLETAYDLQARGFAVTIVPVQPDGLLDLADVEAALDDDVALVSVMLVNNEIGVIQPIRDVAARAHAKGALFHTDAAQAFGKVAIDVLQNGIDLLSISGHKIYGPKGIGALYIRHGISLRAQQTGGGQEADVRSGTLSPALCAGLGAAAHIASLCIADEPRHMDMLFKSALEALAANTVPYAVNGHYEKRYAGNLSITFPGIDGARLISDARAVMMSSGSACASQPGKLSHVLSAIGLSEADVKSTVRLGFGRQTSPDDVVNAINHLSDCVRAQLPQRSVA